MSDAQVATPALQPQQPVAQQQQSQQQQPQPPLAAAPQLQQQPQQPQQRLAARPRKDGAEVTNCLDIDTADSVYEGHTTWCELPRDGSKARQLAQGPGMLMLRNGCKYVGYFAHGRRHGHGKWSTDDGDVYEGDWREDESCGKGKLTFSAGGYYEGEWERGYSNGFGTKVEADCTKYVGQFQRDRRHGMGKLYDAQGALVREGEWKAGDEYTAPPRPAAKKKDYKYADRVRLRLNPAHPRVGLTVQQDHP